MSADEDARARIRSVVRRVPAGTVATYGQVAAEAGLPRRARLVGHVLKRLPADSDLPWHRIINARGEISLPAGSDAWRCQRGRLEEEGVSFRDGRVDLAKYGWRPSLDALLWGPPDSDGDG